jgi:diguanylate cyclase (GGDEF)-like protein/PAS domain S-box-containing protein
MTILLFIYGLAFFILGLSILIYPKKNSSYAMANKLWLIAFFGITHGLNEWVDMFILIDRHMQVMPVKIFHLILMPVSFFFLLQFGTTVLSEDKKKLSALRILPVVLPLAWLLIVMTSSNPFLDGDIWARYLMGIPGTFVTSAAFFLHVKEFRKSGAASVASYIRLTASAFLFYGFLSGFIVPVADFFPPSVLNYALFMDKVGMPVQVFRALCALLLTFSMIKGLSVFDFETRGALQTGVDKLRKSERFLNSAFDSIHDPFMILDHDYRIVRANEAYSLLRNIPMMDLLDEQCHKVIYGKDNVCEDCVVEKTFRSSDPCAGDKLIQLKDGTEAWFDIYTYPISDGEGYISHVIEYLRDITDRKRAEKATKRASIELEQIFNTAADGMCVIDKGFTILRVNKTLLALLGRSKEEVVGRSCYEIFPDTQCNTPDCPLTKILGGTEPLVQFESEKKSKDGAPLHLIVTATAFRGSDGELLGIVEDFKDISERKRMEEELRSMSLRDELTGLYNRRGFITLAAQELKMANRLKRGIYILYGDLDGLKMINDTLGHKEGDRAIRETAIILKETFRNSDIVGRIGGDEFVIIPIGTAGDNIDVITMRLQKNIDTQNAKINRKYKLSISVGIAYYDPGHTETIDELLIRADALMYEQKRNKLNF